MTPSKFIPIALLSAGLAVTTFSAPAEARRGSRGSRGQSAQVDLKYTFSIFDTTPTESPIADCTTGSMSCLFQDAVADLTIEDLTYQNGGSLNQLTIGSSAKTLFNQAYNPGIPSATSIVQDLSFPSESLGLFAERQGNRITYTISDNLGAPIQVEGAFSSGATDPSLTSPLRAFSVSPVDTSSTDAPDERLVTSISYIVDILRGEETLASGFTLSTDTPFTAIDTTPSKEVPEPASAFGLLAFSAFGATLAKNISKK
ncbi:MAG: hypothetical protein AAFR58_16560 [Cyanobacteria bacterium J06627_28]